MCLCVCVVCARMRFIFGGNKMKLKWVIENVYCFNPDGHKTYTHTRTFVYVHKCEFIITKSKIYIFAD